MSKYVSLVVEYDCDTKTFKFDGDGTREYIRRLYEPESNTWDSTLETFVEAHAEEDEAVLALGALGVTCNEPNWRDR